MENKRYILYVKTSCSFCKRAEDLLRERKEEYFVVSFDNQPEALSLLKHAYSYETVPIIFKKQDTQIEFIGGYTDLVNHFDE